MQTSAPAECWRSVAASADGSKLIAGADGGIYESLDGGLTWVFLNTSASVSVACSTNGTRLIASASGGIYTSPDSGVTWNFHALITDDQYYVASSADGMKLAAVGYGGISGSMFISTDAGNTWALPGAPAGFWLSNIWSSVAFSADGTKLVAGAEASLGGPGNTFEPGPIYISTNSGLSWNPTQAPSNVWYSVASSADGTVLAAAAYAGPSQVGGTGLIYTSTNSGATWTPANPPSNYWNSVAVSADGTSLVATSLFDQSTLNPDVIWRSTNSGAYWTEDTLTGYFNSVAIPADGSKRVVTDVARNLIYTFGAPRRHRPRIPAGLVRCAVRKSIAVDLGYQQRRRLFADHRNKSCAAGYMDPGRDHPHAGQQRNRAHASGHEPEPVLSAQTAIENRWASPDRDWRLIPFPIDYSSAHLKLGAWLRQKHPQVKQNPGCQALFARCHGRFTCQPPTSSHPSSSANCSFATRLPGRAAGRS